MKTAFMGPLSRLTEHSLAVDLLGNIILSPYKTAATKPLVASIHVPRDTRFISSQDMVITLLSTVYTRGKCWACGGLKAKPQRFIKPTGNSLNANNEICKWSVSAQVRKSSDMYDFALISWLESPPLNVFFLFSFFLSLCVCAAVVDFCCCCLALSFPCLFFVLLCHFLVCLFVFVLLLSFPSYIYLEIRLRFHFLD